MVSTRQIVEISVNLINFLVYAWYAITVITWITGVDITRIFVMPPIEFEKIVQQYPEIFYALNIGQLTLIMIDQVAVGIVFRRRGIPPPKYVFASSLATLALSSVLFMFLRTTPLWPFYIYFMIMSSLALIHSLAMISGRMKEILPEAPRPQSLYYDFLGENWDSENLYPENEVYRRRRVLKECQV